VKARAFRFGTGRLGRLSAKPDGGRHDGADAKPTHQSFDPAAAGATSLRPQGVMNPTVITLTAVVMDLPDHDKEPRIGGRACAYKAPPPGEIAVQISNTAYIG
jgi:hypothetical protein